MQKSKPVHTQLSQYYNRKHAILYTYNTCTPYYTNYKD